MSCRLTDAAAFVYICEGNLLCQLNQGKEELTEGQGLFINRGNAYRFIECGEYCRLYLAETEASYLNTDALTEEKYVNPVMENEELFYLRLDGESENVRKWADSFLTLGKSLEKKETGYELEMRSCVCSMWQNLFKEFLGERPVPKKAEIREKEKLCGMLEFLHIHYREKITLTEMAENSQVSTGEYCRFFKREWNRLLLNICRRAV